MKRKKKRTPQEDMERIARLEGVPNKINPNLVPIGDGFGFVVYFGISLN